MSSNKKTYQAKSLQQTIPTLKHYSYSKITPNNQSNPQQNQIPISSKPSYTIRSEQKSNKEVILEDERLTTVVAQKTLIDADMSRKKRKKVVDGVSAVIILQSYLDRKER